MKKILFLVLGCMFACSSVDAMENPGDIPVKLVYTKHAQEQMEERGITEADVKSTIESGQKYKDLRYPDPKSFVYKRPMSKGMHYTIVVPVVEEQPNTIVIKTVIQEGTLQKAACHKGKKEAKLKEKREARRKEKREGKKRK